MYKNTREEEILVQAFKLANDTHIIRDFLRDLLTEQELKYCINRLKAAGMLLDGASYTDVQKFTGLGSKTISAISKKLINKQGGYQQILHRSNPYGQRYFD
ncbi:MAG: Trp family transcriptional regulator [Patescibacteria group bacterium]